MAFDEVRGIGEEDEDVLPTVAQGTALHASRPRRVRDNTAKH